MLVLTRRVGEEIVIDGNIRVVVLEAQHGRIRIGIDAPDSVRVDRREIHMRRQPPANEAAAALVGAAGTY